MMIDGITVLDSYVSGGLSVASLVFAILISMGIVGLVILIVLDIVECGFCELTAWIVFVVILLSGLSVALWLNLYMPVEKHYKVTISEEVPLQEIWENYEIEKQEGKIFTIKEKEKEKEQ